MNKFDKIIDNTNKELDHNLILKESILDDLTALNTTIKQGMINTFAKDLFAKEMKITDLNMVEKEFNALKPKDKLRYIKVAEQAFPKYQQPEKDTSHGNTWDTIKRVGGKALNLVGTSGDVFAH